MNSYRDGLIDGEEKGVKNTEKEFIVNMYHNNISIDKISKISKLSLEEVNDIINSSKE